MSVNGTPLTVDTIETDHRTRKLVAALTPDTVRSILEKAKKNALRNEKPDVLRIQAPLTFDDTELRPIREYVERKLENVQQSFREFLSVVVFQKN